MTSSVLNTPVLSPHLYNKETNSPKKISGFDKVVAQGSSQLPGAPVQKSTGDGGREFDSGSVENMRQKINQPLENKPKTKHSDDLEKTMDNSDEIAACEDCLEGEDLHALEDMPVIEVDGERGLAGDVNRLLGALDGKKLKADSQGLEDEDVEMAENAAALNIQTKGTKPQMFEGEGALNDGSLRGVKIGRAGRDGRDGQTVFNNEMNDEKSGTKDALSFAQGQGNIDDGANDEGLAGLKALFNSSAKITSVGDQSLAGQLSALVSASSDASNTAAGAPQNPNVTSIVDAIRESTASSNAIQSARVSAMVQANAQGQMVQSLKIQLHPAELGAVVLHLKNKAGRMHVEIRTNNAHATNALAGEADSIARNLRSLGYNLDEVQISSSFGPQNQGANAQARQSGFNQSGGNGGAQFSENEGLPHDGDASLQERSIQSGQNGTVYI